MGLACSMLKTVLEWIGRSYSYPEAGFQGIQLLQFIHGTPACLHAADALPQLAQFLILLSQQLLQNTSMSPMIDSCRSCIPTNRSPYTPKRSASWRSSSSFSASSPCALGG